MTEASLAACKSGLHDSKPGEGLSFPVPACLNTSGLLLLKARRALP